MSASTEPRILVANARPARPASAAPAPHAAWRWLGWFGLVLALAGLGDWAIALTPPHFGTLEWEFGTIVATYSGLPLVTMGFAGLLAAALARGIRWQLITMGIVLLLFAAVLVAGLVIFALDVPIALQSVQGIAHLGIVRATAKTGMLGVLFGVGYAAAGVAALRHAKRR